MVSGSYHHVTTSLSLPCCQVSHVAQWILEALWSQFTKSLRRKLKMLKEFVGVLLTVLRGLACLLITDEEKKQLLHFVVVGGGPWPHRFDKRITAFAEEKFKRDGIDIKTWSMVVKVIDTEISTRTSEDGEMSLLPYGMVVWSTDIGTHPLIMDFMKQIGQTLRRALSTDEWLRDEGCDNIFAFGGCATINQCKVMWPQYVQEDTAFIFEKAGMDKSGTLAVKEMQEVIDHVVERYPQVELYLKNKQMVSIVDLLADAKVNETKKSIDLNIEEFKKALSHVETQMKNLPATA